MYIFNHIPKCAGLSYRALFEDVFGKHRVEHITINQEEEFRPNPPDYAQFTMLMGHFGVRWNEILAPGRRWMTALREPVDRVVSTYYYWRYNAPLSPESPWLYFAQKMSLDEFVRSGHYHVLQGIKDALAWQLADDLRWRYHSVPERDLVAVAKSNLDQFDFIGLFEEFEESIKRLSSYLGVPPRPRAPRVNVTKKRSAVADLHPSTIEAIMELNRADIELYTYAQEKFRRGAGEVIKNNDGSHPVRSPIPNCPDTPPMYPVPVDRASALRIWVTSAPSACACGDILQVAVEIFNGGAGVWSSAPPNPLMLSYHWLSETGELCVFNGWRSEIRPAIQPFSTSRFRMHVLAPALPGRYTLTVSMVQEFVRWFNEPPLGCAEEIRVVVEPGQSSNGSEKLRLTSVEVSA